MEKQIKFTAEGRVDGELVFPVGKVVKLSETSADRWIRRGVAHLYAKGQEAPKSTSPEGYNKPQNEGPKEVVLKPKVEAPVANGPSSSENKEELKTDSNLTPSAVTEGDKVNKKDEVKGEDKEAKSKSL